MTLHPRIIFMGTPEFAAVCLEKMLDAGLNVVAVVTNIDKPAGRGKQLQSSAVKEFALKRQLPILQPARLKDEDFIRELASFQADIQVVVAFRMLPEVVWSMPRYGTFNLPVETDSSRIVAAMARVQHYRFEADFILCGCAECR